MQELNDFGFSTVSEQEFSSAAKEPEEQALPLEANIPEKSSPSNNGSPSIPTKQKFTLLSTLVVGCPFSMVSGI